MLPEQMQEPEPGVRDALVVHVCRDQGSVFVRDFEGRERWTEGQQQQPEHTTQTGGAVCSTSPFVQWSGGSRIVFSTESVTASVWAEFWCVSWANVACWCGCRVVFQPGWLVVC